MAVTIGSKNVGDIVKIKENGVLVEFLIVHKGLPSGAYDASCDGVWVLRKLVYDDVFINAVPSYEGGSYATGEQRVWVENTYYNLFDAQIKTKIKSVKIPYDYPNEKGDAVPANGVNGLASHCFNLSEIEVGKRYNKGYYTDEALNTNGARLSYFGGEDQNGNNSRIAYDKSGIATSWWTRGAGGVYVVKNTGVISSSYPNSTRFRPAMILDYDTIVADDGSVMVNTAPTTPGGISVPDSVQGGSTITISWAASSDAQGNLEGYKLERSTNGGASWAQIYQGGGTSTTNNVAYGTNTVMYRVKAYGSMGAESGYRTSNNVTVINNTAPGAPQGITVPITVKGGKQLTISWGPAVDAQNNLAGYELERSVNGGTWAQVYRNAQQSFTDNIVFGWQTIAYRVRAYDTYNAYSNYATSEARAVDNNRPPEIACDFSSGSDLGVKGEGFSVSYTVTDPDNNTGDVTVTETFDGVKKKEFTPELGAVNNFRVEGLEFQCLANGQHTMSVSASDGKLADTHTLTFTKSVTSAMITLETPLEADDQITACAVAVSGYIPSDAQFRVLVTNNGNDEEPKWENCTQMVKDGANYVFSNQNAENGYAFNFKITVSRGESGEGGYITSVQGGFQ